MATIYKLRMLSDENDNFLREYDVAGDSTLFDLHEFIRIDLGYDNDGVVSFFTSDPQWERLAEFTLADMGEGGAVSMQDVTLAQILDLPRARLIYLFDIFNDRAMYLESDGDTEAVDDAVYPRVAASRAEAPGQYEAACVGVGGASIFDDAMDEFESFEGSDYYDDEF